MLSTHCESVAVPSVSDNLLIAQTQNISSSAAAAATLMMTTTMLGCLQSLRVQLPRQSTVF